MLSRIVIKGRYCINKFRVTRRYITSDSRKSSVFEEEDRQKDSLRILFCGSDDFSIASLRALHQYAQTSDSNVLSIDVALRADKATGRHRAIQKAPPIKAVAQELSLRYHQFDTFRGWNLPDYSSHSVPHINLIIAVSFGLLIPPRILNQVKYGGLNVHPSMLPDLKGAAPLQWALIKGYERTGVTIQTLHPSIFDEGVILSQEPLRGAIPTECTYEQLVKLIAPSAASMLVDAIKKKLYVPPHVAAVRPDADQEHSLAPKVTASHAQIDFLRDDADVILRKSRALPKVYAEALQRHHGKDRVLRIILGRELSIRTEEDLATELCAQVRPRVIGQPFTVLRDNEDISNSQQPIFIPTKDGQCLVVPRILLAGGKEGPAARAANGGRLFKPREQFAKGYSLYVFHEQLNYLTTVAAKHAHDNA